MFALQSLQLMLVRCVSVNQGRVETLLFFRLDFKCYVVTPLCYIYSFKFTESPGSNVSSQRFCKLRLTFVLNHKRRITSGAGGTEGTLQSDRWTF